MTKIRRVSIISGPRSASKTVGVSIGEALKSSELLYKFPGVTRGSPFLGEILNFQLESQVGYDKNLEPSMILNMDTDRDHFNMMAELSNKGLSYVPGPRFKSLRPLVIHNRLLELAEMPEWVLKVFPRSWGHTPFRMTEGEWEPYLARLLKISDLAFILRRSDSDRIRSMAITMGIGRSTNPQGPQAIEVSEAQKDPYRARVAEENAMFDQLSQKFGLRQVSCEDLLSDSDGKVAASLGLPPLGIQYRREYPSH